MSKNPLLNKVNIDFHILDVLNPKWFAVADNSEWGGILEKPSIIEVTVAGFNEPNVTFYTKCGINQFNSRTLGLDCGKCGELVDLPDGIYTITVKGSPDKYQKTKEYIRTTQMQLKMDKLLISAVNSCGEFDKNLKEKIRNVDFLIRAAKANIRYDNRCRAFELFNEANKLLDKVSKCSNISGEGSSCSTCSKK